MLSRILIRSSLTPRAQRHGAGVMLQAGFDPGQGVPAVPPFWAMSAFIMSAERGR